MMDAGLKNKDKQEADSDRPEKGSPYLFTPMNELRKITPFEQLELIINKVTEAVPVYIEFAQKESEYCMKGFLNDLKLEPDKHQEIFIKHRDHYVAQLYERQRFQYLYNDFLAKVGEWNSRMQKDIAIEIWFFAINNNERLIDGLWRLQRIYGCFFVVENLNRWQNQQASLKDLDDKQSLTKRQRILIHFYEEGKMVKRNHRDYNDYILYSTKKKRLACPNESDRKRKAIVSDITKILPHLTNKGRQSAEDELFILSSEK